MYETSEGVTIMYRFYNYIFICKAYSLSLSTFFTAVSYVKNTMSLEKESLTSLYAELSNS